MKWFKVMKWDAVMKGLLYIALGVVALIIPEAMEKSLGFLIGIVLIITGAVSMINYLLRDAHQNYYHNDFLYGLIEIIGGIYVLNRVEAIVALVPVLLGLLVLISGCSKLQDVIDMKRLEYGNWVVMLIFAVVNLMLGIVLIANPFKTALLLFRILGVGLIFSGLTDCFNTGYFAMKIKKYMQEQENGTTTAVVQETVTTVAAEPEEDSIPASIETESAEVSEKTEDTDETTDCETLN